MSDRIARATELYQEGRYDEAEEELRPELEASPDDLTARALLSLCRSARPAAGDSAGRSADDAVTHADRGWARLREGDTRAALDGFREALRLDPELEFARAGAAEAVEARYWLRRQALAALRGMGRLSRYWWALLLAGLAVTWGSGAVAERVPAFAPAAAPLLVGFLAFFVATWTAGPLSDVVLRFSRFGRLALSRERRAVADWLALCLAGVLAWAGFRLFGPPEYNHLWRAPAVSFLILLLPVSYVNACRAGWPRRVMIAYAGLLTMVVLAGAGLFVAALCLVGQDAEKANACSRLGVKLFDVIWWAGLAAMLGGAWLTTVRPRK